MKKGWIDDSKKWFFEITWKNEKNGNFHAEWSMNSKILKCCLLSAENIKYSALIFDFIQGVLFCGA